ncbi:2-dehydro-3-deoxygluconokinase [Ruegeria sp. ANG-R]|uniref:sugar kinase n=1 Tax=Ruegeria sp. ANG-R TaxID=1577903 RepID=UPI00057E088C|nr:sugar kinase [Ruegeria sp. ANG-R]KIC40190.1 2-dehydro-3-deoxygluconokinase [Ruegeria sp. ANG-R]
MTDLLCLGEPLIELNQQPDTTFVPSFGGDVSNVAIAAARQGASSGMLTRVGKDFFSQNLRDLWRLESVCDDYALDTFDKDLGLYFVTHDEDGHHFTYRRKGSAASSYDRGDLPIEALQNCGILYSSGISLAISESSRDAVIEAAELTRAGQGLFAFDPNLRTALWSLEQARTVTHKVMELCDIALPGIDDARQLTGLDSPQDIADFYHDLGPSVVALTMGNAGVFLSSKDERYLCPPHSVSAVDATGAGDCFNGAFLAAHLNGMDLRHCGAIANAAAALSTCSYGAISAIPSLAKTIDFLETTQITDPSS